MLNGSYAYQLVMKTLFLQNSIRQWRKELVRYYDESLSLSLKELEIFLKDLITNPMDNALLLQDKLLQDKIQ